MTTTHELLRQARALLDRAFWRQPEATALIVAIDDYLSAPQQTPEAWGCFGPDGKLDPDLVGTKADCESWRDADDAENKWTVAPLYTSLHHLSAGEPAAQRTLDALHKEITGFDEIQIERVPLGTKATYLQNNQPVCWLIVEHSASPGVVVSLRGITGSIEVKLGAHD